MVIYCVDRAYRCSVVSGVYNIMWICRFGLCGFYIRTCRGVWRLVCVGLPEYSMPTVVKKIKTTTAFSILKIKAHRYSLDYSVSTY